ncbi:MAG: homogentisate 1,2-dioxygenase, partial [Bdellovibrionales bacterium]
MKKRQAHKNIPKGCFEEEQGQEGFFGPASHLIRKNPSTRWSHIEGSLKPRMFDLISKNKKTWTPLFYNDNLAIHFLNCTKHSSKLFKSANGDLLYFCHKGEGVVLTEYGLLNYHSGQYIVLPKSLSHVFIPSKDSSFFVIESLKSHFRAPERGLLGRHALYDSDSLVKPDLKALNQFLQKENLEFKKMLVHHEGQKTLFTYKECLFDVVEWKGDLFPYTLDMKDIMPVMS